MMIFFINVDPSWNKISITRNNENREHVLIADVPRFTRTLNDRDYAVYGKVTYIVCCAEGYDHIDWYRLNGNQTWEPFPNCSFSLNCPDTKQHGQILEIPSPDESHNTLFRCDLMKNNAVYTTHTDNLTVSCKFDQAYKIICVVLVTRTYLGNDSNPTVFGGLWEFSLCTSQKDLYWTKQCSQILRSQWYLL